jgi:uridine kinase
MKDFAIRAAAVVDVNGASPTRRDQFLDDLAADILSRKADRPLKVAIDGRCGAGKTSLADELGRRLSARGFQVLRSSVDGFHHSSERRYRQGALSAKGYYEDAFDFDKIVECLLAQLSGEAFPISCHLASFDHGAEVADDAPPVLAQRNAILLFDGIFLFRRELDAFWNYRVLLCVDFETCLARALPRDAAAGLGTRDDMARRYALRYEPAWRLYENEEKPSDKANIIVDNRNLDFPRLLTPSGRRSDE